MNLTLEIKDSLGEKARHRAVDAGKSLSSWVTSLIEREVAMIAEKEPKTLLEALSNSRFENHDREDFLFEREVNSPREIEFK